VPSIHGGSLRVFGGHAEDARQTAPSVNLLLAEEARRGLRTPDLYRTFQARADRIKDDLLTFLIEQKRAGRTVAGYGAAAKGNTLLNYAGVKSDLLPFVCDAAPSKQGKILPGSRIPIVDASHLKRQRPDRILILQKNRGSCAWRPKSGVAFRLARQFGVRPKVIDEVDEAFFEEGGIHLSAVAPMSWISTHHPKDASSAKITISGIHRTELDTPLFEEYRV
jgi:hypothetical protein